ncbi:MAG: hypothetical protein R3C28_02785 [Pirellulaceae bacterium]
MPTRPTGLSVEQNRLVYEADASAIGELYVPLRLVRSDGEVASSMLTIRHAELEEPVGSVEPPVTETATPELVAPTSPHDSGASVLERRIELAASPDGQLMAFDQRLKLDAQDELAGAVVVHFVLPPSMASDYSVELDATSAKGWEQLGPTLFRVELSDADQQEAAFVYSLVRNSDGAIRRSSAFLFVQRTSSDTAPLDDSVTRDAPTVVAPSDEASSTDELEMPQDAVQPALPPAPAISKPAVASTGPFAVLAFDQRIQLGDRKQLELNLSDFVALRSDVSNVRFEITAADLGEISLSDNVVRYTTTTANVTGEDFFTFTAITADGQRASARVTLQLLNEASHIDNLFADGA